MSFVSLKDRDDMVEVMTSVFDRFLSIDSRYSQSQQYTFKLLLLSVYNQAVYSTY